MAQTVMAEYALDQTSSPPRRSLLEMGKNRRNEGMMSSPFKHGPRLERSSESMPHLNNSGINDTMSRRSDGLVKGLNSKLNQSMEMLKPL